MAFSFSNCSLTTESLEITERFLDLVFTHPGCQFAIKSLDLSGNAMNPPELAVVARIVAKSSSGMYRIEELTLNAILPKTCLRDYRPPVTTPREFFDLVRAAFTPPLPSIVGGSPHLSKISMDKNVVSPQLFVAMFSTLRYGCPLEEDASIYTASQYQYAEMSTESWSWLAFGLFYPRSKRFADRFKLRTIGKINFSPMAIKILVSTLRNPVAELVYGGESSAGSSPVDDLMVCTVKRGAEIEIFDAGSPTKVIQTKILPEISELEALCEREDGSVCVVVPGIGLGWVHPAFVTRTEREPLESCRSDQDGCNRPPASVFEFLCPIGAGIFGLQRLVYPMFSTKMLAKLVDEYHVKLTRLTFHSPLTIEISGLLDALSGGELGSRLQVLNLYEAGDCFDDVAAMRLFTLLGATANPPVLQELRLSGCRLSPQALEALSATLQTNCTLALIELDGARFAGGNLYWEPGRFDAAFHDQLLQTTTLMATKLAFLSVVTRESQPTEGKESTPTSALNALDPSVLTSIFEFAAPRELWRTVVWKEDFKRLNMGNYR